MIISDPSIIGQPCSIELEVAYEIGDTVYHVSDEEGTKGIVCGYLVRTTGLIYQVTWGNNRVEQGHFGFELTGERPI